jgi:hypothetical protein
MSERKQTDVVFIVRLLHRTLYSAKCVYVRTLEYCIRELVFRQQQQQQNQQ